MNLESKPFQQTLTQFGKTMFYWLVALGVLAYFAGLFHSNSQTIQSDAEQIGQHQTVAGFWSGKTFISGGHRISQDYAFSGSNSVKLTKEKAFGFGFDIPSLKGTEAITISVWRYAGSQSPEPGVIVGNIKGKYWEDCTTVVEHKEGWERLECTLDPPFSCKGKDLSIYCWNRGNYPIYFDDLKVIVEEKY